MPEPIPCDKKCRNRKAVARYRARHPERARASSRRYTRNLSTERRMLYNARSRANRKGIPVDITEDDILIPEVCPVLGLPIKSNRGGKAHTPNSPTLDRMDPSKGYVRGNVRVISFRANLLKSDATAQELRSILKDREELDARI